MGQMGKITQNKIQGKGKVSNFIHNDNYMFLYVSVDRHQCQKECVNNCIVQIIQKDSAELRSEVPFPKQCTIKCFSTYETQIFHSP